MKKNLIVLTGAGVSAESGLKTFRDSDGLWMGYDVYEVASPQGWQKNPELALDFYNQRRKEVAKALPNAAHKAIADLQTDYNVIVITQNIDDLHERAGSQNVIHLHGEIFKMRSENDENTFYEIRDEIRFGEKAADGFQLRPHVVWFGEQVPMKGGFNFTKSRHIYPKLRIRKLKWIVKDLRIVPESSEPRPSFFAECYF